MNAPKRAYTDAGILFKIRKDPEIPAGHTGRGRRDLGGHLQLTTHQNHEQRYHHKYADVSKQNRKQGRQVSGRVVGKEDPDQLGHGHKDQGHTPPHKCTLHIAKESHTVPYVPFVLLILTCHGVYTPLAKRDKQHKQRSHHHNGKVPKTVPIASLRGKNPKDRVRAECYQHEKGRKQGCAMLTRKAHGLIDRTARQRLQHCQQRAL